MHLCLGMISNYVKSGKLKRITGNYTIQCKKNA